MLIVVRYAGLRFNIFSLFVLCQYILRAPHGGNFAVNIHIYILYWRGLYHCYCMHISIFVLNTFHSAPAFPRTKSGAVSGDYRGCKASVKQLCVRNLPSGGFAILSAFQVFSNSQHWPLSACSPTMWL